MLDLRDATTSLIRFLRQPSLGRSVVALLSVAIALMLAVNVGALIMIGRTAQHNEQAETIQDTRRASRNVLVALLDAETGQRGFLLTGRADFLRPYTEALARLPDDMGRLRELAGADSEYAPHAIKIEQLAVAKIDEMQRTVDLAQSGRGAEAIQSVRNAQGKLLMDQVRAEVAAIDAIQGARLDTARQRSEQASRTTVAVNAVAGLLIVLLGVVSAWLVRRYVLDMQAARAAVDRLNAGLEDKVRERTAALSRANEEIQRFAYIVSHDLRAPLVNIMGYTSELEQAGRTVDRAILAAEKVRDVDPDVVTAVREEMPEAIGFVRASSQKMDRLINAILKLSRDGRRTLTPEPVDMTAVVQQIADSVRHQTEEAGATITVETLPPLVSDRLAVEQVFGNLVDNAVKYLDATRPGRITVSGAVDQHGVVTYRIADNGRGVDARDHERIFELFRRAGRQDKTGEGLGLAFVRNSVRRLGGDITLESELGRGSTFIVTLPKHLVLTDTGEDA